MQSVLSARGVLALLWLAIVPCAYAADGPDGRETPHRPGGTGEAAEPRPKVLILGMDGLRTDALLAARAPNLHRLIRDGSFAGDALADRITRSGPGWAAIFTGAWSPKHGVIDNQMGEYRGKAFPHFFRRIKDRLPEAYTASVVNWAPIHEKLVAGADRSLAYGNDDSVAREAVRLLTRADPDVLFLHFDAPDYAGHRYGFSRFSPPYMRAIRRTDARVGEVLAALASRAARDGEEWLILGVTDHGGTLRHHGEDVPACRRVPLIVAGDASIAGLSLEGAALVDVAPTVLSFLGIEAEPGWNLDGRPLPLRLGRRVPGDRLSHEASDLADEQLR